MKISLDNVGKRFNREWVFRHFSVEFNSQGAYAITGPNGSGKSTLLQIIAGATMHSEGAIAFYKNGALLPNEHAYRNVSIAAPYLELIEEFTAVELLHFHGGFKTLTASIDEILLLVKLDKAAHKQIRYFSSGMKQRLKLAQAFFSDSDILLLDEPSTNLDSEGFELYQSLISNYTRNRLLIISSNVSQEFEFCNTVFNMGQYK